MVFTSNESLGPVVMVGVSVPLFVTTGLPGHEMVHVYEQGPLTHWALPAKVMGLPAELL